LEELAAREREMIAIDTRLEFELELDAPVEPAELRQSFIDGVSDLPTLLKTDTALAKAELRKRVSQIRMTPELDDNGSYFVAEGDWDVLGKHEDRARTRQCGDGRIRMRCGGQI
jgi:hypothetical protein